jgi:hypothetical protein
MKAVLILFIAVSTVSCAGTEIVSYKALLSRNLTNLNKLSIGMTKSQVLEIMGNFAAETRNSLVPNPYKTEPFIVGKTQYEALYYMTQKYPSFTSIKLSQATPVILKEGQLIGWSVETLQGAKAGMFEK